MRTIAPTSWPGAAFLTSTARRPMATPRGRRRRPTPSRSWLRCRDCDRLALRPDRQAGDPLPRLPLARHDRLLGKFMTHRAAARLPARHVDIGRVVALHVAASAACSTPRCSGAKSTRALIEQSSTSSSWSLRRHHPLREPAASEILGFHPSERVGRSVFERIPPGRSTRRGLLALAREAGRSPGELQIRHRDGVIRCLRRGRNLLAHPAVRALIQYQRHHRTSAGGRRSGLPRSATEPVRGVADAIYISTPAGDARSHPPGCASSASRRVM